MKRALILFCLIGLLPVGVYAASFKCDKARTEIEKTICTDPKLSDLDSELASVYKEALKLSSDQPGLKKEQSRWIKEKRNASNRPEDIQAAYLARIESIRIAYKEKLFARNEPPRSVFGRYSETEPQCFNPKEENAEEYDCSGDVESYIELQPGPRNSVKVKGDLWFFNGHECGPFEAEGEWVGGVLRVPQLEDENRCVLLLSFKAGKLLTEDPASLCKEAFLCGANAGFHAVELPKIKAE